MHMYSYISSDNIPEFCGFLLMILRKCVWPGTGRIINRGSKGFVQRFYVVLFQAELTALGIRRLPIGRYLCSARPISTQKYTNYFSLADTLPHSLFLN